MRKTKYTVTDNYSLLRLTLRTSDVLRSTYLTSLFTDHVLYHNLLTLNSGRSRNLSEISEERVSRVDGLETWSEFLLRRKGSCKPEHSVTSATREEDLTGRWVQGRDTC